MTALISDSAGKALNGSIGVPGDKSISHRALLIGASAIGETRISGLLEGDDVLATARALQALGTVVERQEDNGKIHWRIVGRGVGGLVEPAQVLDLGNSGTGARLLMGLLASQPLTATFSGDASLSARPMGRVMTPLVRMGAAYQARENDRLPLTLHGAESPLPITYELPVASAQVKSAVLLAGLNTPGRTTVVEPQPTRDHTERMLRHFGAALDIEEMADGGRRVSLTGQPELTGKEVFVPADISSAAFPLVAALLVPGSKVSLPGIGLNPLRSGLLVTLSEMGGQIDITNQRQEAGEPVADLTVVGSALRGVDVPAGRAPSMIDEYPVLAVAAACAEGVTRLTGLAELRVKESDRLSAIADGLKACGVGVEETDDGLVIEGCGGEPPGGGTVEARHDHRIAMSFLVLGMAAAKPVCIDDGAFIDTSFPGFADLMNGLGASIQELKGGGEIK